MNYRNLTFSQVFCSDIIKFGFALNDGTSIRTANNDYNIFHEFDPAKKITSIEHILFKDEFRFLQMNFYHHGERIVCLGKTDDLVEEFGGIREIFQIADDEHLIACRMDQAVFFYGVTWIKMKVFWN